jgi:hypothetical protein
VYVGRDEPVNAPVGFIWVDTSDEPAEEERLEGDGQEFYTMAPSTLSFRSTAPLNELQNIQINGQTVDPSNYTLEEGSTIVKLKHDYLSTLDVGNYELSVVSDSKTVKGDFTVVAPELNEYGFYYNQPYYVQLSFAVIVDVALIFHSENFVTVLDLLNSIKTTKEYAYHNGEVSVNLPGDIAGECPFVGTFSADGRSLSGITDVGDLGGNINTTFEFTNSIVSDNIYIYWLEENDSSTVSYFPINDILESYPLPRSNIRGFATNWLSDRAFADNQHIVSVSLPGSLQYLGDGAFSNCSNLTNIIFNGTTTQWDAIFKLNSWNYNVPATHVHCVDGDVAL